MKKLSGILVLGLLWFNASFAQILNLDNNLEIKIPNGYKLYEISISEIIKNDPNNEFVEWITDAGEDLGWENPNIVILAKKEDSINLLRDYFSDGGSDKIAQQITEHFEKAAKKKGRSWAKRISKNESKMMKWVFAEILKKYKFYEFYFFIIGDKELDFMTEISLDMSLPSSIEELQNFKKEIESKGGVNYLKKEIEENLNTAIEMPKNKYNITNLNYGISDDLNYLYLDFYIKAKWFHNDTFIINSASDVSFSIINKKLIYANSFCLKKNSCNKMPKIKNVLYSKNLINNSNLSTEIKPENKDLVEQLGALNDLYKSGALTKEEFTKAKKKLLN